MQVEPQFTNSTLPSAAAVTLLLRSFPKSGKGRVDRVEEIDTAHVPGRVNLIGEHIDYHSLPVLPMAIDRGITIAFRPTSDGTVEAVSDLQAGRAQLLLSHPKLNKPGDWSNYIAAAIVTVQSRWPTANGLQAAVVSNLPPAAGLSSSSALLAAFAIALLRVNGVEPKVKELMEVMPEGEQVVGTRGGGMDHAVVLANRAGCALHLGFDPLRITPIPLPEDWIFIVAHSRQHAEKSGALRERYNDLREAGRRALTGGGASEEERTILQHVLSESARVQQSIAAIQKSDLSEFGRLLDESHASLRDRLQVSTEALDRLVLAARKAGAAGARLTGAGFGGCVIAVCHRRELDQILRELSQTYYGDGMFAPEQHLFAVSPSRGALIAK